MADVKINFSKNVKLLGDVFLRSDGSVIETEVVCNKYAVLGLYFAATWCPSCIAFTSELIKFYKNLKSQDEKHKFEIIYVSSDADEKQFFENVQNAPWIALPYSDKERRADLTKSFHIQRIPTLIFIDGKTCDLITPYGKSCVLDDPQGTRFPWRRRDPISVFNETFLLSGNEDKKEFKSLPPCIKGIYFSANWCPPCRVFTPLLLKLYHKLKKSDRKFEIIFVSSDLSLQSFTQHFKNMPWFAVPYEEEQKRKELAHLYDVGGIPSLVILDENNSVITKEGRTEINDDPDGEDFPWRPKLVDELSEKHISKLNEEPCLIYFTACEEKELDAAHYLLLPVAEEYKARIQKAISDGTSIPRLNFFYAGDAEICDSVKAAVQMNDALPFLVILDVMNHKQFVLEQNIEITTDIVRKFVRDFLSSKLSSKPI